jgi:hypothetical protein
MRSRRLLPSPNLSPLGRGNGEGAIFIKFKIEKVNIISYAINKICQEFSGKF